MTKYIYIAVDDDDFSKRISDTGAEEVMGAKANHYNYGITPQNHYIVGYFGKVSSLRRKLENNERIVSLSFHNLIKEMNQFYLPVDLESDHTISEYVILIHFGGLDAERCRHFSRRMKSGCTLWGKRFQFIAVSQANSYPPEYWKNGALVFPDERERPVVHSPDLNHLKSFYRQCQNILSEPNYIDRFNDSEFWFLTLWDGTHPKTFDKAFSESEISLLLDDENKDMKDFFETLLFSSPSVPDVTAPATVVHPALASATAFASVPASATISVPASVMTSGSAAPLPVAVASASSATPGFTVSTARTVSETASIDAPTAYKIISQIMRIFNPPKPVYVPAYSTIKFSCFSKGIVISSFVLIFLVLIAIPFVFLFVPMEAEYETESETRTPVLPVHGQKGTADVKKPFSSPGIILIDQRTVSVESKPQLSENGRENADNSCRMEKTTKKAAPFQYFHIFLFFSVYALGGILCFIICQRFLRIHSREQKILHLENSFSNLGRFIFTLKPEDQDAIVKQFAQASIRLYFNGDDGE